MQMIRMGKTHNLNIVGIYKKGKRDKLSVDNIRLVLDNVGDLFNGVYNTGKVLCIVKRPEYDKNHFMSQGTCGITGLPMKNRPEFMGDLDVVEELVQLSPHIKVRNYNYYEQDINSSEVKKVLQDVINEIECFL